MCRTTTMTTSLVALAIVLAVSCAERGGFDGLVRSLRQGEQEPVGR